MKHSPLFSCKNHPESDHQKPINSHGDNLTQRLLPGGWSNGSIFLGALGLVTLVVFAGLAVNLANRKEAAKGNHVDARLRREPAASIPNGLTGPAGDAPRMSKNWGANPLSFEINQGQADRRIKYLARGNGYGLFLTSDEAIFALRRPQSSAKTARENAVMSGARKQVESAPAILKMKLNGASRKSEIAGLSPLQSKSNYFIGADSKAWRKNIAQYSRVQYSDVYPGVDLVYYGNQRQLEYDFIVAPGSDPKQIKFSFDGVAETRITEDGDLALAAQGGELLQHKPVIYQEANGVRRMIEGRYTINAKREIGFEVAEYDRSLALVIDPVLSYSTYLGGADLDFGNGIAVDNAGFAYVTGIAYSVDFPLKNQIQITQRGVGNAFVAKFNPQGALVYSTYLGAEAEDGGFAIAADSNGNAYVAGSTDSTGFPTASNGVQPQKRGLVDAFVTKLSSTGDTVLASTYLGGQANDIATSIALDGSGNIYLTGETFSGNFPTSSPFQFNRNGASDAFVTKLNNDASRILYSTHLGGNGQEVGYGIAVDASGSAYVTGTTNSGDFPVVSPVQPSLGGRVDIFVTKLSPGGGSLVYSSFIGAAGDEVGYGIGVDSSSNAYVVGLSSSTAFPTVSPIQGANAGGDDVVVLKLSPAGALTYSTYLGGAGDDRAYALAVDASGAVLLGGSTTSNNFPTTNPMQSAINSGVQTAAAAKRASSLTDESSFVGRYFRGGSRVAELVAESGGGDERLLARTSTTAPDGFLARISAGGAVIFSTYLGGGDEDQVFSVAAGQGAYYASGMTASGNFPTLNAAFKGLRGVSDAFITKINESGSGGGGNGGGGNGGGGNGGGGGGTGNLTSVSSASYIAGPVAPDQLLTVFGAELAPSTGSAGAVPLPTSLGGVSLKISASGADTMAPLLYASPKQINYLVPANLTTGDITISLLNNGAVMSTETLKVTPVSPGIFTANSTGHDAASGVALRVNSGGQGAYESILTRDGGGVWQPAPINVASAGDQVYLILFGTGLRYRSSLASVSATIGGVTIPVSFVGAQGEFVGLDQINIPLPASLAGRGVVDLILTVDGVASNAVKVNIQ